MPPRISPLRIPPIWDLPIGALALTSGRTRLAAFSRALEMGAAGLESDVWVTADGQAVLDHDGQSFAHGPLAAENSPISDCRRDELPDHMYPPWPSCSTNVRHRI